QKPPATARGGHRESPHLSRGPMACTERRPITTSLTCRGTELKPEQAPADSAPRQSPWPCAEEAGDLFTRRKQPTPADGENHDTPPSPGREALQALQAEAQANQPAPPPPPRCWTFPLSPQSLVTAGCV